MWKNPAWFLWMIPALAAACLAAWAGNKKRARLDALLGSPETLKRLLPNILASRRRLKFALQAAALVFLFLALAGPQWGIELVAGNSKTRQILIMVDTSLSMAAQDAQPSRLEAAKRDVSLLLDELSGNRIGLMAFSGQPALICPMTRDGDALRQAVDSLAPDMLPTPGTAIANAVAQAAEVLRPYAGVKSLIILSDGEDHQGGAADAAKAAAPFGVRVYAIGLGTPEGSPIALRDSSGNIIGYKKDSKGETVVSRLHEDILTQLASATGGAYYRAGADQSEVSAVAQQILKTSQAQDVSSPINRYRNHFQWPLALALVLLLADFLVPEIEGGKEIVTPAVRKPGSSQMDSGLRRNDEGKISKTTFISLTVLVLFSAMSARAQTTESDIRQGNKLYNNENYLGALDDYSTAGEKNPDDIRPVFNSGDALFRLQDMDQAQKAFSALGNSAAPPPVRSAAYYNLGDIDFSQGNYKQAVSDFRRAVTLDPNDADARYNLAVALRALKNPPPKQKNQKQNQPQNRQNPRNQNNPKPQGGGQNGQNQPPQSNPQNQISQDDAKRIMQAVANREKPMTNQAKNQARQGSSEDDW